jgi:hypothetical protein
MTECRAQPSRNPTATQGYDLHRYHRSVHGDSRRTWAVQANRAATGRA